MYWSTVNPTDWISFSIYESDIFNFITKINQFDALKRRLIAIRHGINEYSSLDIVHIELLIDKNMHCKSIDTKEIAVQT